MNSWQWIQILGFTGVAFVITKFRTFLKNDNRFSRVWSVVTSLTIGLCMGGIADAIVIPSRMGIFMLVTFLAAMSFAEYPRHCTTATISTILDNTEAKV